MKAPLFAQENVQPYSSRAFPNPFSYALTHLGEFLSIRLMVFTTEGAFFASNVFNMSTRIFAASARYSGSILSIAPKFVKILPVVYSLMRDNYFRISVMYALPSGA